jgi:hypothetical protein
VEEDVRQLMDITSDTLISAIVALLVSGPVAYVVGLAQSRRQRLEERRAEVIAELFRLLYIVQDAFIKWSHLEKEGATSRQVVADRYAKRGVAAFEALNDLILYYYSNEPWLYPSTSAKKVEEFVKMAESITDSHPPNLKDIDFRKTDEGQRASIRMSVAMPQVMSSLIEEFREIINPPPWYVRALEWLEARGKRGDAQQ